MRILNIFERVVNEVPKARLLIVGDGNLFEQMNDEILNKKLDNNVRMLGFQSNPYKYMKNSKILIMTSLYEGIPMCALEGMSFGLPIIATPTDGLVEIIDQNVNGFYSNKNDELCSKIVELLKNKSKYKKMSVNALEKAREINDVKHYKKILDEYYFE
jgi:glycosyltransferase involved in cell wall biosynthesis